jgi:RNA ligase (TIGR02306 family)
MSTTQITVERVNEVKHHPNADRLDLIQVLGYWTAVGRDEFKVGDSAIYFPPDILIPETVAEELGVTPYLKHSIYPGDLVKTKCRVSAARLRGVPSHGFAIGPVVEGGFGIDVTGRFQGVKYVPPVRTGAGGAETEWHNFWRYTNIEPVQKHPHYIQPNEMVRITEKIHGTNCRLGLIRNPQDEFEFVAGSHRVRRSQFNGSDEITFYWKPMTEKMMTMLTILCDEKHDVVVFGEIFGEGVQDMDYGRPLKDFRIFDICVDGRYLDWQDVMQLAEHHGLKLVPLLYVGPYSPEMVEKHTYGPTNLAEEAQIKSKFKEREGCVITPMRERVTRNGARCIVKSVSADYRNRKGAKDIE